MAQRQATVRIKRIPQTELVELGRLDAEISRDAGRRLSSNSRSDLCDALNSLLREYTGQLKGNLDRGLYARARRNSLKVFRTADWRDGVCHR